MPSRSMADGERIRSPVCRSKNDNARGGAGTADRVVRHLHLFGVDQAKGLLGFVRHGRGFLSVAAFVGGGVGCAHTALPGIADRRAAHRRSLDARVDGCHLATVAGVLRSDDPRVCEGNGDQLRLLRPGRSHLLADTAARRSATGRVADADHIDYAAKLYSAFTTSHVKRAAIGVRAHSGRAALVSVCGKPGSVQVLDRIRTSTADAKIPRTKHPHHFAERLELRAAEKHIASCAAGSERLALAAIRHAVHQPKAYKSS